MTDDPYFLTTRTDLGWEHRIDELERRRVWRLGRLQALESWGKRRHRRREIPKLTRQITLLDDEIAAMRRHPS